MKIIGIIGTLAAVLGVAVGIVAILGKADADHWCHGGE